MALDFEALGFLWPQAQTLMNINDESLDVEPNGITGEFGEADEGGKYACRLYKTGSGKLMTELEIMHWFCGGSEKWLEILKLLRAQIGDNRPTRVGDIMRMMTRYGINSAVTELTLLRLIRSNYATLKGVGENALFTITNWSGSPTAAPPTPT
jgi:hypothetical protein